MESGLILIFTFHLITLRGERVGRKRRKIIRRPVIKPFPKLFSCPICGQETVTVYHETNSESAKVICTNCGVCEEVKWYPAYAPVDAYADFYDKLTQGYTSLKLTNPHLTMVEEIHEDRAKLLEQASDNHSSEARVVSFVNYKGGVGKTTLAVEISAALAYHYNKKVLLIDADPQSNATFYLMEETMWENFAQQARTIKELFDAALRKDITELQHFDIRNIIVSDNLRVHDYTKNLHLIPSHLDLYEIDIELARMLGKGAHSLMILWQAIRNIKADYDYIIIDCPPNMYLVTQNAIVASDGVIITLLPEYLSRIGIALIVRMIDDINQKMMQHASIFGGQFKSTRVMGIIFNRVRYGAHGILSDQSYNIQEVRKKYGDLVFNTLIRESVRIAQRPLQRIPISISGYQQDRQYEESIREVAREFLKRFEENEI